MILNLKRKRKEHRQSNNPTDFNASNMRKTTDDYHAVEFTHLKKDIISAAQDGYYKLDVKKELHKNTISKLKELGFTVTNHIPADMTRKKDGIHHTISWNH